MKKKGFTLSEVLITVVVIGIVAAMTIPTLMNDYHYKTYSAKIKKSVYEFSSAVDMFITEEGKTSLASTYLFDSGGLDKFMQNGFNVVQTCSSSSNDCFASSYSSINGSKANFTCSGSSYTLSDGSAVCVTLDTSAKSATLNIDINSTESPNMGGRDMFSFTVDSNGVVKDTDVNESTCKGSSTGDSCFSLLRDKGFVMDY